MADNPPTVATMTLTGADGATVRAALDSGDPLPGTGGFAGELDGALVSTGECHRCYRRGIVGHSRDRNKNSAVCLSGDVRRDGVARGNRTGSHQLLTPSVRTHP